MSLDSSQEKKTLTPANLVWWRNKLLAGLFVIVPLAATLFILKLSYDAISYAFNPAVTAFVNDFRAGKPDGTSDWEPAGFIPEWMIVNDTIPFAAFFITLLFIMVMGLLVTNIVGRKLLGYIEGLLLRIPLVNQIYPLAKQVMDSIKMIAQSSSGAVPEPGDNRQVVFIRYPGMGGYLVAFQTGSFTDKNGEDFVSVFIPTAPNPITGFVLIFKASEVIQSDLSMEDAWKLLVSAGFVTPPAQLTAMPVIDKTTIAETIPAPVDTTQTD
ncbi:MAG: DUF502 domain-containing protein [Verrucomicrobiota bacterium]